MSIDPIYNTFFCLRNKLEGWINFLRENGKNCEEEYVLLQYIYIDEEYLYSKDNKEKLDVLRKELQSIVARVHKEFSPGVLELIEKKISYTERLAILLAGNCYNRASLRLKFTLDIYDFLVIKHLAGIKEDFCYIFSEATATLCAISGAINISPFDVFYLNLTLG